MGTPSCLASSEPTTPPLATVCGLVSFIQEEQKILEDRPGSTQAEEMSTIGSFEGFQPVSLKQEGDDQPSEADQLSTEEGDPGTVSGPRRISRLSSVTESTLYPNPYHQPYTSRKYFVTRPGAIETAMEDLTGHIAKTSGETIQGFWLLTERQGEGLRIYWGRPEQQSLLSRWNPWSTEVPYATFTEHPMKYTSEKFLEICKLSGFTSKLVPAIQNAHKSSTGSGRGKGLMVLTEPILLETYTGLMSFIGNRNKLGYSLARGSIGF
ncbi:tumor protein p63-regulated gene 1 protein isoform X3 [Hippopotamus amphibius kiboko]|uniref:tumor protein p63-regulated gene 1 protein isoform X3 n=1 Tax=Hippopotamus amphibius kiboko TaxID=575201 RepID=UPI002591CA3A|nr:tumor protein p63-regulated gene 1 protein isoform X3 [Hippopotamus amphibius kiboko]